jgi:hypothetical protein
MVEHLVTNKLERLCRLTTMVAVQVCVDGILQDCSALIFRVEQAKSRCAGQDVRQAATASVGNEWPEQVESQ